MKTLKYSPWKLYLTSEHSTFSTFRLHLTYHSDGVVEQRLPEHEDVEQLVDVDLLEHSEDSHGVDGRDDGAEQQTGQQVDFPQVGSFNLTHGVHHPADEEGVPQSPHHREHEDGAQVLCEGPDGQEVAGIEDDGRQQVEEEELRVEDGGFLANGFDDAADQQTDEDQQTAFGDDVWHSGDNVKTCREREGSNILISCSWKLKSGRELIKP